LTFFQFGAFSSCFCDIRKGPRGNPRFYQDLAGVAWCAFEVWRKLLFMLWQWVVNYIIENYMLLITYIANTKTNGLVHSSRVHRQALGTFKMWIEQIIIGLQRAAL
jgi:hypothetical protein